LIRARGDRPIFMAGENIVDFGLVYRYY